MWKKIIKFLVVGLLMYGLIFAFSQNDQRANRVRLNNNGLSTAALVFPSKSKASLKETLTKIEEKTNPDDQFQLQFITDKQVVYVYAHGYLMNLPLTAGRNFTNEDFLTSVPLAVVGKEVKKHLYSTNKENYYELNQHYISIIGYTGSPETELLNRRVFISVNSSNVPKDLKLKQLTIVGDGPMVVDKTPEFRRIFHAKNEHKFLFSELPLIGSGWLKHSWGFILAIVVIFVLLVIVVDYQFEFYNQKRRRWANLRIIIGDFLLVTFVLWLGLRTQYIMNHYFLTFFVYLFSISGVGLGHYFAHYRFLNNGTS